MQEDLFLLKILFRFYPKGFNHFEKFVKYLLEIILLILIFTPWVWIQIWVELDSELDLDPFYIVKGTGIDSKHSC